MAPLADVGRAEWGDEVGGTGVEWVDSTTGEGVRVRSGCPLDCACKAFPDLLHVEMFVPTSRAGTSAEQIDNRDAYYGTG